LNNLTKNLLLWLVIAVVLMSVFNNFGNRQQATRPLEYSSFIQKVKQNEVDRVTIQGREIAGKYKSGESFTTYSPETDNKAMIGDMLEHGVTIEAKPPDEQSLLLTIFINWFPLLLLVGVWVFFMRQMQGGVGGRGAMSFGKSKARMLSEEQNKITFDDVAGVEEAKEEVGELVEFLRDPSKFQKLGGRIPKGVLMTGSPGTGKTLLAKAIAGEAKVPFFSISGSDFVEMFVGVGASRVRDMFEQAKKHAPCIIFIDEIDAVGRQRGAGLGGGHDEREQTLNQLLVEMDGFEGTEGVIVIAATNRPDVLDPALLRPGRFDRQVYVPLPDIRGREQILKVHMRKVPVSDDVDANIIARGTPGFSGADLANLVNEAALFAARANKRLVDMEDFERAKDKVVMGAERRSIVMPEKERRNTAYHESGHTVVAKSLPNTDPVHKVTIIPRGFALGATHFMPKKNRVNYWKKEILDQLAVLMGGRVAEEIFAADISSGAQMDFSQATKLARSMICQWGMNDALGQVSYDDQLENGFSGFGSHPEKKYSEETARQIDEEVRKLLNEAHQRAHEIILSHRDQVQLMADMLMEFETLYKEDVEEIIAGKWDSEKKKERIKALDEKYRKRPPPPPPELVKKEDLSSLSTTDDPSPQPT